MLWKTHLAFGFLCGLIAVKYINLESGYLPKIIFFSIVLFASLMADIDEPRSKLGSKIPVMPRLIKLLAGHRGMFHSAWFPILISFMLLIFYNEVFAISFMIGYLSHVFIDGFTKSGVNLLHPFTTLHLRGFVETGSFMETLVFLGLLATIAVKLFVL